MLYAVEKMDCDDSKNLFQNMENLEHGTLIVEAICTVIQKYGKYAEIVATLVKEIREKTYEYHDEMLMMSMKRGFGEERFVNGKVCKLLLEIEDDIREFQKIITEEENALVDVITRETEITGCDAMVLPGLRKCIEISKDMICALYCVMQITNKYVVILKKVV